MEVAVKKIWDELLMAIFITDDPRHCALGTYSLLQFVTTVRARPRVRFGETTIPKPRGYVNDG